MFKVNEYFGGNVKSLAFQNGETPATIGVMAAGEYEFGTNSIEIMQIVSGVMKIKLPESTEWKEYKAGESFRVEAGKKFQLILNDTASYLCLYL